MEPLTLKHIRLLRGPQAARLDVNLTNIQVIILKLCVFGKYTIFGPSMFKIRDLKIDPDNVFITFKVGFQKLDFRRKYQINAQILLLNIVGDGDLTGSFLGYDSDCLMKSQKIVKNNNTYVNFEKMKIKIKINKAVLNFENLFGGDSVLGSASNEILNSNSDFIIDEIKPVLEDSLSDLFTRIANKITLKFTYDDLFPNN
ncbi:Protein takeout [Trachymyrmex zeteki]|uniref:Protein takeout n=1 Tax=Mycetomoellerius zeteki TaxID=64791 RepID=A0A151WXH7_9HYME|nr:Protein takeout [Trachymyrmex zeteki]